MSAVERLEALINIETDLKSQYDTQLQSEVDKVSDLSQKVEALETKIAKQMGTIAELSVGANEVKRLGQTNRELSNRADKFLTELEKQKGRAKELQKENIALKSETKALKHLDAEKVKKNLLETKKKLQEKTKANDLLNKSNKETKLANVKLKQENETLTAEVEKLKPEEEVEDSAEMTNSETTNTEKTKETSE